MEICIKNVFPFIGKYVLIYVTALLTTGYFLILLDFNFWLLIVPGWYLGKYFGRAMAEAAIHDYLENHYGDEFVDFNPKNNQLTLQGGPYGYG